MNRVRQHEPDLAAAGDAAPARPSGWERLGAALGLSVPSPKAQFTAVLLPALGLLVVLLPILLLRHVADPVLWLVVTMWGLSESVMHAVAPDE